jgi:hypothetical protein
MALNVQIYIARNFSNLEHLNRQQNTDVMAGVRSLILNKSLSRVNAQRVTRDFDLWQALLTKSRQQSNVSSAASSIVQSVTTLKLVAFRGHKIFASFIRAE